MIVCCFIYKNILMQNILTYLILYMKLYTLDSSIFFIEKLVDQKYQ